MISSSDSCRQLVAGNYDVILDDDEIASFKSVLSNFLVRFEHHENELLLYQQQQQQQQQQHQSVAPTPLLVGSYVEEFKMLKELSRVLKENPENYIDGLEAHNQPKNRYKDIIPFNHTRVVLDHVAQLEPGSNYINANYVQGPNGSPRSYIACQGPLPHTLIDFWRMIWECRVSVIVMACNEHEMGRSKCEQYWPKQMNGSSEYGNIRVNFMGERQINSDFLIRKFSIQLLQEDQSAELVQESEPISSTSPQPTAASTGPNNKVQTTRNQPGMTTINDDNNNNLDEAINTTSSCNEHGHNLRHTNETFSNSGNSSATSNESINTSDYSSGANLNSGQNSSQKQDENCQRRRLYQADRCHEEVPDGGKTQTNRTVLMERTVCQFHFQGWQDHGVPDSVESILELIRLIREVQPGYSSSIVVHCSAGCGRTGTICCIDYVYGLMRMGKLTPDFDLFTIISHMRQQRMAMVQTIEQYILCHRAVAALFVQQLQMLEFSPNQNRFLSANQQAAGYNELAAQNQLENGQDIIEKSSKNDTSGSTEATDELSGNSKFSNDQSDNDEDQDIGPVFI